MIQPGQKLKEGDYVVNIKREQSDFIQIFYANHLPPIHNTTKGFGFVFNNGELVNHSHGEKITNHDFADFRQLCENTFGDGAK